MKHETRKLIAAVVTILVLFTTPIKADVGPKPSINITINNAEGHRYYVALLASVDHYGPWTVVETEGDANPAEKAIASYKDKDGFYYIGNISNLYEGNAEYRWTYMPPDTFKVVIYDADDNKLYVSDIFERTSFDSYFNVEYGTSPLIVKEEAHLGRQIILFVLRLIMTIIIELLIALLFKINSPQERKTIIIVNIITQVLMNFYLAFTDYYGGLLTWLILFPLCELIVFVVELIVYMFTLRKQGKGKVFFYTVIANMLSAGASFLAEIFSLAI